MMRYVNRVHTGICVLAVAAMALIAGRGGAQALAAQPWQRPYADEAVKDESVLGAWLFQPGAEGRDATGQGRELTQRGRAAFLKEGPFGGCLDSFGPGDTDAASGAQAANSTGLTPAGAFTIEMWIRTKPEFAAAGRRAWLFDKMVVAYKHANPDVECRRDYAMQIEPEKDGRARLIALLGFSGDLATFQSQPATFEPGVWHHVAFAYDGAGRGAFYRDGVKIGESREPGRGPVTPGSRPVTIGDRGGSSYAGFAGAIAQVRLSGKALRFYSGSVSLTESGRMTFIRLEKDGRMEWRVDNNREDALSGARLALTLEGAREQRARIPRLEAGGAVRVSVPVDVALRPGRYAVRAAVLDAGGRTLASATNAVTLVPRPLPFRMPVIMWGAVELGDEREFSRMKEIGFTHSLYGPPVTEQRVWDAGRPTDAAAAHYVRDYWKDLDRALASGHTVAGHISSAWWLGRYRPEFQRVDRAGKPYAREGVSGNPCGLCPGAVEFCYNVGASIARSYGAHPALQAALIHSEVRDTSEVCFHESDRAAYRTFSSAEMPDQVVNKNGVSYKSIKDFPDDRVIADDDPLLTYYRWFWKQGDGWNALHSAVHRGLKSTGRKDLWTWFDPAVRAASVYGSGGEVDVVSQWSYSYPDPIRIAQATDELFTMAAGAGRPQRVMKMTQIIWYRSRTAPKPKPDAEAQNPAASWKAAVPEADFITIAPDHLRAAFWTKIARPVQGIMYHGWQSLVDCGKTNGYCYTHPQTKDALAQLVREVVEPLGATLLQVPDIASDVGFLESFASEMFAGRGSRGWCRNDMYLLLQYAQLQPRVLYDETVLAGGLKGLKVLVMSECDVLTRSVADAIRRFQQGGGLIVADEHLAPAITPDMLIKRPVRKDKPDEDKAAIQAGAAELRAQLDALYQRPADSSNPDIIARVRRYKTADYLFAVNDRRTFGDYVGQWGLVMEKGLPAEATLSLNRPAGHAYDLVAGRPIPAGAAGGALRIPCSLGAGGGRVFLVTDRAIAGVEIAAPRSARRGRRAGIRVAVADAEGRPLEAVVPVQVEIRDAEGNPAEWSGYYGAKDGRLALSLDLASNDAPGPWTVKVRELASGRTAECAFQVK